MNYFIASTQHLVGIEIEDSLLISICPDGDNTFVGSFISQDGYMYSFDIDCDDRKYSKLEKGALTVLELSSKNTGTKPWDPYQVAMKFFINRL
jgi:hypothetical protein